MFDFRRIGLVVRREVTTRFRMRAYRWTLVIQVLVALIAGFSPIIMSYFAGDQLAGDVIVVDATDSGFADRLQANVINDIPGMPALEVTTHTGDAESAREAVKDGDASVAVIVTQNGEALDYEVVTNDSAMTSLTSQRVQSAIYNSNIEIAAQRAGVPADQASALVDAPAITVEDPGGESSDVADNFSGPVFAIVNIGLILTYIMFIMYGTWIAQGVVEEKASRMMEIMVNAATPRDLLVGKVIGVLVAGLCQLLPMVLAGALAFALQPRVADALDITLVSSFDFDLAAISVKAVLVFLVYFILGYMLIGAMFAAAGSTVSRQEEVNQAVGPAIILIVIGLFLAYFVIAMPNSLAAKIMFLIPFTSPYIALPRIMLGDPSALEIALSIAILAVSGVLAMMGAAMVYRTGVLMYGQKVGLIGALRLRKSQQVAR